NRSGGEPLRAPVGSCSAAGDGGGGGGGGVSPSPGGGGQSGIGAAVYATLSAQTGGYRAATGIVRTCQSRSSVTWSCTSATSRGRSPSTATSSAGARSARR